MDNRVDLKRIASVLRKLKPDLVALQEIDHTCTRSGKVDQAAALGTLLGMHHRCWLRSRACVQQHLDRRHESLPRTARRLWHCIPSHHLRMVQTTVPGSHDPTSYSTRGRASHRRMAWQYRLHHWPNMGGHLARSSRTDDSAVHTKTPRLSPLLRAATLLKLLA